MTFQTIFSPNKFPDPWAVIDCEMKKGMGKSIIKKKITDYHTFYKFRISQ